MVKFNKEPRRTCSFLTSAVISIASFLLIAPLAVRADQDGLVAKNAVVRIECGLAGQKKMVSTGFAWRSKTQVVATLHGVAGCDPLLIEGAANKQASAKIVAANLEADLAILELNRDIGLIPVALHPGPVNPRGDFYSWGHPDGVRQMRGAETNLGITVDNTATSTLKSAHAGTGRLDTLFADDGQNYPGEDARILIVTSPIVSGQSGSPILDTSGRVVGIVDGTIRNGVVGMNWAISALDYLPYLHDSSDRWPDLPSKWAGLKSKVAVVNPPAPTQFPIAGPGGTAELGSFLLVRRVSVADYEDFIRRNEEDEWLRDIHLTNIEFMRDVVPEQFEQMAFDIYEDQTSGATVGIPSGLELMWNAALGLLEARTNSNQVKLFISVRQYESFDAARSVGKEVFVGAVNSLDLASWDRPLQEADFGNEDASIEWAEPWKTDFSGEGIRTDVASDLALTIGASGNTFVGYAAFGPEDIAALPDQGLATWLMMQIAVDYMIAFSGR